MLIVCPACASEYTIAAERIGPRGRRVRCAACRESWHAPAPEADGDAPVTFVPDEPPALAAGAAAEIAAPTSAEPAPEVVPDAEIREAEPPPDVAAPDRAQEPVTLESRDHAVAPTASATRATERRGRSAKTRRPKGPAPPRQPRRARLAAIGAAVAAGLACASVLAGRNVIVAAVPEAAIVFERLGLPVNVVGLTFAELASSMNPALPGGGSPGVLTVEGRIENPTRREIAVPDIDIAVRGEAGELLYNWSVPAAAAKLAGGEGTSFRARLSSPPPAGQRVQVTFRMEGRDVKVALR